MRVGGLLAALRVYRSRRWNEQSRRALEPACLGGSNSNRDAARELRKLDVNAQRLIVRYLRERIATDEDPRRFGRALTRELKGLWRYRVGDYRIVASIEDERLLVLVITVGHRREVYE